MTKTYDERWREAMHRILIFGHAPKFAEVDPEIWLKYDTDPVFHALAYTAAQLLIENEDLRAQLDRMEHSS